MSIKSTKDYSMFKITSRNRDIDQANLDHIIESIKQENHLDSMPILLNKDMVVIDGQHRLKAAEVLDLPIFYKVDPSLTLDDIWRFNSCMKAWKGDNFMKYYAEGENENYIKLRSFCKRWNYPLKTAFAFLGMSRSQDAYEKFEKGAFKFPSDEELKNIEERIIQIQEVIDFIETKTPMRRITNACFVRALIYLFNSKDVDFKTFMTKLEFQLGFFRRCSSIGDYLKVFEQIYNWKNRDPISIQDLV